MDLWPMLRQHAARIVFDFAEGDGLEASGTLQAQREPTDAAE
jgi:hypothetical protein